MNDQLNWRELLFAALFMALLAVSAYLSMPLSPEMTNLLLKEGGVVETASAIGYFLCIAYLFWLGSTASVRTHWYLYVLLFAMALRELDFDKRFTDTGVLQSKFLIADDVGVFAKMVGGSVVFFIVYAFVTWILRHHKAFVRDVLQFKSSAWAAGFALAFIVFTKSIDGLGRKLEPFGVEITAQTGEFLSRIEEVFELGIPITFTYAICLYWRAFAER